LTPWRTIGGNRVLIGEGRVHRGHQAVLPSSAHKTSFTGIHRVLNYPNSKYLIKYQLPAQRVFADEAKSKAVDVIRRRYGASWAEAASAVLDQLIKRAVPAANWSTTEEVQVSRTKVVGDASAEFTLDPLAAAGVRLPNGAPAPELYASASFRFRGNLKTGRLELTRLHIQCGFKMG
jgi:hypothetical protein